MLGIQTDRPAHVEHKQSRHCLDLEIISGISRKIPVSKNKKTNKKLYEIKAEVVAINCLANKNMKR